MRLTPTQRRRRRGQTMMEYVLIICLIAAAIAAAVYFFGDKMRESITENTELVGAAAGETSYKNGEWSKDKGLVGSGDEKGPNNGDSGTTGR